MRPLGVTNFLVPKKMEVREIRKIRIPPKRVPASEVPASEVGEVGGEVPKKGEILEDKYLSSKEICKIYNITSRTLLNWCYAGKIKFIRTKGNHRRYINPIYEDKMNKYCYCRSQDKVSLDRQIEYMKQTYPNYEIISDIGLGSDTSREGFTRLLDLVVGGKVSELVLFTKDTLCTNGYEIVEKLINKYSNGEIIVSKPKVAIVEFIE